MKNNLSNRFSLVQSSVFILLFSFQVQANSSDFDLFGKAEEDYNSKSYYMIKNQQTESAGDIQLLDFVEIQKPFPKPTQPYKRDEHFGGWIDFKNDSTCLDTRGLVLQRDSLGEIEIGKNCRVQSGAWNDDYSGQKFYSASDIQIDHVVALKNAYMTGASEWSSAERCLYANYLGNNYHLKSVSGYENLKKGDKSPREYIPPFKEYVCSYLLNWLKIKRIWNLKLTPKEKEKIEDTVESQNCNPKDFVMTSQDLQEQYEYKAKNKNICFGKTLQAF